MKLGDVVAARIHPAIGIARVGDSDEYFIGPETPAVPHPPRGGYKDGQGRIKRQAARFRVFGYDRNGKVVGELTKGLPDVSVTWQVHVANKKAAWYDFLFPLDSFDANSPDWLSQSAPRRNPQICGNDRTNLIVDAGLQSVPWTGGRRKKPLVGAFFGKPVLLGEMLADDNGCLVFIAGKGTAGSIYESATPTLFANNPGWHDDIADGPVGASVSISGRAIPVDEAWVVTAPPNYAPNVVATQTLYDVIEDAYAGYWTRTPDQETAVSFATNVWPIFERLSANQWVNRGFLDRYGWKAPYDFENAGFIDRISARGKSTGDPNEELRREIYYLFRQMGRDPATEPPFLWPPVYGSAYGDFSGSIGSNFVYTPTTLFYLKRWYSGTFTADYGRVGDSPNLSAYPVADRPAVLDRAALHWCIGGPFHPGCELTWIVRQRMLYRAPLRIRRRARDASEADFGPALTPALALTDDGPLSASGPGDLTKWMAVPWHTDTASCRAGYDEDADVFLPTFWPARVPNHVMTEDAYDKVVNTGLSLATRQAAFHDRAHFFRGIDHPPYLQQLQLMIGNFGKLGILEPREGPTDGEFPSTLYVETGYGFSKRARGRTTGRAGVSLRVRFGHRGLHLR